MSVITYEILDTLFPKYNLRIWFSTTENYYFGFRDDGPKSYIGRMDFRCAKYCLYDGIHLKHEMIMANKEKPLYFTDVEPFEKQLNEIIKQRKVLLAKQRERKINRDFK